MEERALALGVDPLVEGQACSMAFSRCGFESGDIVITPRGLRSPLEDGPSQTFVAHSETSRAMNPYLHTSPIHKPLDIPNHGRAMLVEDAFRSVATVSSPRRNSVLIVPENGKLAKGRSKMAATQVSKALLVRLEALPGREDDVRDFLNQGLSIVDGEPKTVRWFAIQFGPSSFGIFDAFPDDDGRQAHLSGEVAKALGDNTGKLFEEPVIEHLDVVAEKQPA